MNSVESTVRAYFEAPNCSDVEGVVDVFTEDATLMRDELDTVTGREQIRRSFAVPSKR